MLPVQILCSTIMAIIHVSSLSAMVDEKLTISATGLKAESNVTIRSVLVEGHFHFEAHAHYAVDKKGEIHLGDQPSLGGMYTGVEPMGLFWSMQSSPGQAQGVRYSKKDVTTPMIITLSLHIGHLDAAVLQSDNPITRTIVKRWYMGKNVERIPIRRGKIRGVLFKPKGPGPFPGIIDSFGAAGGCIQIRAALLASHGYATLALAFYNYEDLPKSTLNISFEYFEEAVTWFSKEPYVKPGGIGAVGVSTGAMIVLLMASVLPDKVSAVVGISSPVAMLTYPFTMKGEPMKCLKWDYDKVYKRSDGSIVAREAAEKIQSGPEGARIEVEKAKNLLFVYGQDDLNWPCDEHAAEAKKRLDAHGHQGYRFLSYPGTGHLIEPPYAPVTTVSYFPPSGKILAWGGTTKPHAYAQEDSWNEILIFFRKHVDNQIHNTNFCTSKFSKL